MSFYSQISEAKDGNPVPLCKNGAGFETAMHSKYNPLREAEGFAANIDESALFFVILGIAGGYHIQKVLEKCPKAKILAVETDREAIDFLEQIPLVKSLSKDNRVIFSTLQTLEEQLLCSYKPAVHGNLTILSLRQWETFFASQAQEAREKINAAIKLLAQDYSVQSHFGKIWHKNILSNLGLAEKSESFEKLKSEISSQSASKTAAVIAAGPSLDESVKKLIEHREDYFIIATDTAFSSLLKQEIESDAVVSIDGQMVSHQHYLEKVNEKTVYCFDLCANSSSARKIIEKSGRLIFFETGHPLCQYASMFSGKQSFLHLEAGSGTVTIAAASLAQKLGFPNERIEFFGADFSYINGRPYARGTYLEGQFHSKSSRFNSSDKLYSALMYRTPLQKISETKYTTEILEAYKNSLVKFMKENSSAKKEGNDFGKFSLKDFKVQYCKDLRNSFKSEDDIDEASYAFTTLLPLCAKLGKGSSFLAYLKTLIYTERV